MTRFFELAKLQRAARVLWALVLLTIPVSTFPYIPGPLGRTSVKPLALFPLALLLPVLVAIILKHKRLRLPANLIPLLAFLLFALAASVLATALPPLELRGVDAFDRGLRAWVSVALGLSFFFSAFWMNRSREDLRFTLKWLYIALGLTLLWSLVQALAVNTDLLRRSTIDQFQLLISERGVQPRRVTGFAFEPAWLADQLVIYFMPWLFAAMLTRFSFLKQKWLEWLLFALSALVLFFTFSRAGLLGAALAALVVLLVLGRDFLRRALGWLLQPFSAASRARTLGLLARVALLLVLVLSLYGSFVIASDYEYFASIWTATREDSLVEYLLEISVAQRAGYALAAYEVFESYPLSGVGLGASGLYLIEHLPNWALEIPEVARLLSPDSNVILNPKSLYARLLAETGLPGLLLFMAFMLSFVLVIRAQLRSGQPWQRYAATAGLFAWTAIMIRNLTQDSLTWPIMWVSLGLIVGLSPHSKREEGS